MKEFTDFVPTAAADDGDAVATALALLEVGGAESVEAAFSLMRDQGIALARPEGRRFSSR